MTVGPNEAEASAAKVGAELFERGMKPGRLTLPPVVMV